jgi:cobalamin biosynthesis Mg chelatase CobN
MHVVFRESRGLEETATPRDIGQDPADLVVLSYSDSDLAAFAAGWRRGRNSLPSLRLANLAELRHPLSVDTYIERTLSQARGILVRLIGGESYWWYGLAALQQLAKDRGIVLAVLRPMVVTTRGSTHTRPCRFRRCVGSKCSATPAVQSRHRRRLRSSRWPRASMPGRSSAR